VIQFLINLMEKPDSKNITTLLGIMVFLFLTFDLFAISGFAAQKNQCLKCHKSFDMHIKKSRLVSKKACGACHLAEQRKKHPKQKNSIKLKDNIPGLCYACHENPSSWAKIYISLWQRAGVLSVTMYIVHGSRVFLSLKLPNFAINVMTEENSRGNLPTKWHYIHAGEDVITHMQVRTRIFFLCLLMTTAQAVIKPREQGGILRRFTEDVFIQSVDRPTPGTRRER